MTGPYRRDARDRSTYPTIVDGASVDDDEGTVTRTANLLLLGASRDGASLLRVSPAGYETRVGDAWRLDDGSPSAPGARVTAAAALRHRFALMSGIVSHDDVGAAPPEVGDGWIYLRLGLEVPARDFEFRVWLRPRLVAVISVEPVPPARAPASRVEAAELERIRELIAEADARLRLDGDLRGAATALRLALRGAALLGPEAANERSFAHEVAAHVAHAKGDLMEAADAMARSAAEVPPGDARRAAALGLERARILAEAGALEHAMEGATEAHRAHVAAAREAHPAAILALDAVAALRELAGHPEAAPTRAAVRRAASAIFGPDDPLAS